MTDEQILQRALQSNDPKLLQLALDLVSHPLSHFRPRPDDIANLDQQSSFYYDQHNGMSCCVAGNGCLAGEQKVFDPVEKTYRTVSTIKEPFHVHALSSEGKVIAKACRPFIKGVADIYEITLSNNETFRATLDHKILSSSPGKSSAWRTIRDLIKPNNPCDGCHITHCRLVREDFYYDFTVPVYHNYELAGIWHHNSGKTYVGAAKVASFLLTTPPPEKNTPFWVLSTTQDLVTNNCWCQNLSRFIPESAIADITWLNAARGQPRAVILKPHTNGSNYIVEFKSYDQDRRRLQGANTAGAWLDEQCPFSVLMEVWARTRKWGSGKLIYTLTPLEPDQKLEEIYNDPPESWKFFRMNTRCNKTLDPNFVRQIEENELAELIETRMTGAFARFEGQIYPNFSLTTHVIEPFEIPKQWLRVAGLDLGWQHQTAAVYAARDLEGRYYVYREYCKSQTSIEDHIKELTPGWNDAFHKGKMYADPANQQVLHEFAIRGLHTHNAHKDVKQGIAHVQSLLRIQPDGKPKLYIFKTCPTLIQQMRAYVFDINTGKPKKETSLQLYDVADSIRYLCFSYHMDSENVFEAPKIKVRPKDRDYSQPLKSPV